MPSITTLSIEGATIALMPLAACLPTEHRAAERAAVAELTRHLFGDAATLTHTPAGAPRVDGRRVSIAHSRTQAAMAYHTGAVIGIDLESSRPQLARVMRRFLRAEEAELFGHSPELLLRAWTAKEAVYKAVETLAPDLAQCISLAPDLTAAYAAGRRFRLTFRPLPPDLLCLATEGARYSREL